MAGTEAGGRQPSLVFLQVVKKKCIYDKDKFNQYPVNGEFEIKTDDGKIIKNTDVATNFLPIKVFNKDFIEENISYDPSDVCNPIVYVSEEDIESKKRLRTFVYFGVKRGGEIFG